MPCACGRIRTSSSSTTTSRGRLSQPCLRASRKITKKSATWRRTTPTIRSARWLLVFQGCGALQALVAVRHLDLIEVLELVLHLASGLVPPARVALHGVQDDLLESRVQLEVDLAGRLGVARDPGVHDDVGALPLERRRAGHHLVEDRAQAVDVAPVVPSLAADLLRGYVVGSPQRRRQPDEGQAPGPLDPGYAEVEEAKAAVAADHDVLRLQVAVGDPVRMEVLEGVADPCRIGDGLALRQLLPLGEHLREGLTLENSITR